MRYDKPKSTKENTYVIKHWGNIVLSTASSV